MLLRNVAEVHALPVAVGGVCGPAKRSRSSTCGCAETIDDGHRDLKAALLTIGQGCARGVQRDIEAERFVGDRRLLRAGRNGRERRTEPTAEVKRQHHGRPFHDWRRHHLLTGDSGSNRNATMSLICCSFSTLLAPKRGMFEHASTACEL